MRARICICSSCAAHCCHRCNMFSHRMSSLCNHGFVPKAKTICMLTMHIQPTGAPSTKTHALADTSKCQLSTLSCSYGCDLRPYHKGACVLVLTAAPQIVERKVAQKQSEQRKKLCTRLQDGHEVGGKRRTASQPAHMHYASCLNSQGCNFTNTV